MRQGLSLTLALSDWLACTGVTAVHAMTHLSCGSLCLPSRPFTGSAPQEEILKGVQVSETDRLRKSQKVSDLSDKEGLLAFPVMHRPN